MKSLRIVLSFLCLSILACSGYEAAHDDEPSSADVKGPLEGLGTSPSKVADSVCPVPIYDCGIWVADTAEQADSLSLACAHANVVVWTTGHTTCVDAVTIAAERYPGRGFVRRVDSQGRALEAAALGACP